MGCQNLIGAFDFASDHTLLGADSNERNEEVQRYLRMDRGE